MDHPFTPITDTERNLQTVLRRIIRQANNGLRTTAPAKDAILRDIAALARRGLTSANSYHFKL